jgi:hypothetical protein
MWGCFHSDNSHGWDQLPVARTASTGDARISVAAAEVVGKDDFRPGGSCPPHHHYCQCSDRDPSHVLSSMIQLPVLVEQQPEALRQEGFFRRLPVSGRSADDERQEYIKYLADRWGAACTGGEIVGARYVIGGCALRDCPSGNRLCVRCWIGACARCWRTEGHLAAIHGFNGIVCRHGQSERSGEGGIYECGLTIAA